MYKFKQDFQTSDYSSQSHPIPLLFPMDTLLRNIHGNEPPQSFVSRLTNKKKCMDLFQTDTSDVDSYTFRNSCKK